jgi:iron complex outermembrane receptor protein
MPTSLDGANGGWSHTNPKPIEGGYDIREAFVEFVAPLAQDLPLANSLELNGGLRYADYSTSGGVTAWKLGVSYEPVDMLRIRATRSRDIRAANIVELYTGSRQSSGIVREPGTGNTRNFVGSTQGNPRLDPEIAETYTVGVVFQPSFDDFTLRASVDFFDMSIDGAVASFSAQQTLDRCAAGSQIACAQIQEVGGAYRITLPFLNLDSIETRGVDFEAGYSRDFMGGELGIRGLLTYMDRLIETDSSGVSDDLAGDVGTQGLPKWAGNLNVSYKRGPLSVFLQERYIGGGKYNRNFVEGVDVADNKLDPIYYTDLTVRYEVLPEGQVEVYTTINNLFNQDPHIAPQQSSERFRASNFGIYDSMGRYITVGAKARF